MIPLQQYHPINFWTRTQHHHRHPEGHDNDNTNEYLLHPLLTSQASWLSVVTLAFRFVYGYVYHEFIVHDHHFLGLPPHKSGSSGIIITTKSEKQQARSILLPPSPSSGVHDSKKGSPPCSTPPPPLVWEEDQHSDKEDQEETEQQDDDDDEPTMQVSTVCKKQLPDNLSSLEPTMLETLLKDEFAKRDEAARGPMIIQIQEEEEDTSAPKKEEYVAIDYTDDDAIYVVVPALDVQIISSPSLKKELDYQEPTEALDGAQTAALICLCLLALVLTGEQEDAEYYGKTVMLQLFAAGRHVHAAIHPATMDVPLLQ